MRTDIARPRSLVCRTSWVMVALLGLGCPLDTSGVGEGDGGESRGSTATGPADGDPDPPGSDGGGGQTVADPQVVCDNVLVNPSAESGNLEGWEILQSGGALVSPEHVYDGHYAVRTSFEPFLRQQEVDLVAAGLRPVFLDTSPEIVVEDWFREVFSSDDYLFAVQLLDQDHQPIDQWEVVASTVGVDESYDDDAYFSVQHTFRGYPPGLRYVRFRDGGQDGEYWQGHYGVVIDASRVEICHPR